MFEKLRVPAALYDAASSLLKTAAVSIGSTTTILATSSPIGSSASNPRTPPVATCNPNPMIAGRVQSRRRYGSSPASPGTERCTWPARAACSAL